MFIIPIGTKSTLALKPKITIGLIIINIIIAIFSFPMMMKTEGNLLDVQRLRFAKQIRLYIKDHRSEFRTEEHIYLIEDSIRDIENAEDWYDLEYGLMSALSLMNIDFDKFEEYEQELIARKDEYYDDPTGGGYWHFSEWKDLKDKESKVLQGNVIYTFGLVPSKMVRAHTFFTYQFFHGGIWHLLGNMLFLWVVGCLLEDTWGRGPFLIFYLLGGAFAGWIHCLQDTTSIQPLIGASGSIAAAMGAFTIRHFMTKIRFFYFFMFFFRPFWGTFHLPAFVFLPFWFMEQLFYRYITGFAGGSDVAYLAHIAGYTAGIFTALIFKAADVENKILAPRVQRKQVNEGVLKDPRFDRACAQMDSGNTERAKEIFGQLIADRPGDVNTLQDIAIIYREHGYSKDYEQLTNQSLKALLLAGRYEEASCIITDSLRSGESMMLNPQYLMRVAKWHTENDAFGEAHDIYRVILRSNASPQASAKASIALAKLLYGKMNNPRDALAALEKARQLNLDAEWNERIEEMEAMMREMSPEPLSL